jgi:xylulose-5-phosphate/fructose-6-phosphate phosphoketolase
MATIDRLPKTGGKGLYLKQQLKDKLIEHKQCIDKHGQDLPEIRNRKWSRDGTLKEKVMAGKACV